MFNLQNLKDTIDARIASLGNAEKIVREELRSLSRDVLFALHEHGDHTYVNKLVKADMTPMNRKALVLFFREFTGFHYDDANKEFTKKDKKLYDDKAKQALEFLEDPMNNFWTWADREVKMEAKGFDPKKLTAYIANQIKKAEKDGFNQADVIRAVLNGGLEVDTLVAILEAQAVPAAE